MTVQTAKNCIVERFRDLGEEVEYNHQACSWIHNHENLKSWFSSINFHFQYDLKKFLNQGFSRCLPIIYCSQRKLNDMQKHSAWILLHAFSWKN